MPTDTHVQQLQPQPVNSEPPCNEAHYSKHGKITNDIVKNVSGVFLVQYTMEPSSPTLKRSQPRRRLQRSSIRAQKSTPIWTSRDEKKNQYQWSCKTEKTRFIADGPQRILST